MVSRIANQSQKLEESVPDFKVYYSNVCGIDIGQKNFRF